MIRRIALSLLLAATSVAASAVSWQTFDYAKQKLTAEDVAARTADELRLMRGIVFGRHGRIFGADRDIDGFLRKQSWYKPNRDFTNDELNGVERANLDVIRGAEAKHHAHVQPGDLRWWKERSMTEEQLGKHGSLELRVMLAEIEAIDGRMFDDVPTLQRYFNSRYWYVPDENYTRGYLNDTERHNMAVIEGAMRKQRSVSILPGEYAGKPITAAMLDGLGLYELRLLRNEIYARRGYPFKTNWLIGWFSRYEWYQPRDDFNDNALTATDKNNVALITARERTLHEALATTKIDPASLDGLFTEDLRRLRNEIYARHGRPFKDRALHDYFSSFGWYKPDPAYSDASLTTIERANVDVIRRLEDGADSKISFEG